MIKENKLTLYRCEEVPEAQQYRSHQELSVMAKEPAEPRQQSCHPELVSGSYSSDNGKILNRVQNDRIPEAGQNFVILSERSVRRILSIITRSFASLRMTKCLRYDNTGLIKNYQ